MADNNSKKPMALLLLVVVAVLVVILMTPPVNCTGTCKGDSSLDKVACETAGKTWEEVEIHVRPQGIKLIQEATPVNGMKGTVMASRLMGEYSFVHLSVLNENNEVIHVHSHMPPSFYPKQSSAVGIEVDLKQAFIFTKK